jgi:hypothetical protein
MRNFILSTVQFGKTVNLNWRIIIIIIIIIIIDNVFATMFKIYCITETWLNGSTLNYNLFPESYYMFRADRD